MILEHKKHPSILVPTKRKELFIFVKHYYNEIIL